MTAFAVTFGLSWLARRAKGPNEYGRLTYGPEIRAIGWISVVIGVAVIIIMFTIDHGGQYWAMSGLAALFLILGTPLLLETYLTTGRFDESGITVDSVWKSKRVAKWTDLQRAKFESSGQEVDLFFADGTKIRLNKYMRGLDDVCNHIESIGIDVVGKPTQ